MSKFLHFLVVASLTLSRVAIAAEWQWSAPVPPAAGKPADKALAFLWIPPNCQHVRAVIFGHNNMEEQPILEHPVFRKAASELGFAEVWVAPGFDRNFRYDQGAGERFDAMMKALADESGFTELTTAPLVPVGHSAAASMPWYIAYWKPERVLACISFSGQWPYVPDPGNAPPFEDRNADSVPGIVTLGEYEWADERMKDGLKAKADHPAIPLSGLGCPADGHFAPMDDKVEFLALYLKKAAQYRLPKTAFNSSAVKLNPIDVTKTGWLVDRYHQNKDATAAPAPVGQYKGDLAQAFWWFDEEIAKAANEFQQKHRGKVPLLGYVQDGKVLPQDGLDVTPHKTTHQQVTIPFNPADDGVTIQLSGTFLDTVPGGRPTHWSGQPEGATIEKPADGPPIEIRRITGPIRKISEDKWELAFDRTSFLGDFRGNEAWLVAIWPGDGTFKRMVQQSKLAIPGSNKEGQAQQITFETPSSVRYGTRELKLTATANSGLPVRYFVRSGPAEVDGSTLKFTQLPMRAKFPVKVTVVAWQFGRSSDPKIQTT